MKGNKLKIKWLFQCIALTFLVMLIGNTLSHTTSTEAADSESSATINFTTGADYVFDDGSSSIDYKTTKEAIETVALPQFKKNDNYSFKGWKLTKSNLSSATLSKHKTNRGQKEDDTLDLNVNQIYQPYELLRIGFYAGDSVTFEAVYEAQNDQNTLDIWEKEEGSEISNRVPTISGQAPSSGNIIVYSYNGTSFNEVSNQVSSPDNFRSALYGIYAKNDSSLDYVVYVGSNITLTGANYSSIGDKTTSATSPDDVTFYSLNGKAKSITITGSASDPVDNTTLYSTPTSSLLSFSTTASSGLNFGTNVEFRNIRYNTPFLAANGYSLTLGGGSWGTSGTNIYGGSFIDGAVTGQAKSLITINSTGAGTWNIYGGSNLGNYTGNTNLVLNGFSSTISTLTAGNNNGTLNGNTALTVNAGIGTITNIYGGTVSGTTTGNVQNKMYSKNSSSSGTTASGTLSYGNFYGGSASGTVKGNIDTIIAGYGRFTGDFYGGSDSGSIGTVGNNNYIHTVWDSSLFGTTGANFAGGNRTSGVINANITNTVRAGWTTAAGALVSANGSTNDRAVSLAITDAAINSYAIADKAGRRTYAAGQASTSVSTIGSINTHLLGGAFSDEGEDSFAHATGIKGYFEGDAIMTVGILKGDDTSAGGYNFCTSTTGYSRVTDLNYKVGTAVGSASTLRTYTQNNWDIFGGTGGSTAGNGYNGYVYGNTSIVQNNVLARWTYGGGYGGAIDGDTTNTVYGGLVDTLEGGGYSTRRIWGNTQSNFHNGEVNFFFSGGGWNDDQIFGNATAYATGGIINCAIGGTYGASSSHIINGNSDVYVTGGDFSGYPSHGTRGFSGGPTNLGTITGNVSLTLDLRKSSSFTLPKGINISGGRNTAGNTSIGTDENNTITLNIYTNSSQDVLNGAILYGDGGSTSSQTKSGHIIMNIDAPNSTIGSLYATNYSNISSNTLLKDVDINVLRAGNIGALSGTGNVAADNITNTIYTNSAAVGKSVDVKLGEELLENTFTNYAVKVSEVPESEKTIKFGTSANSTGLINFTSLSVNNGFSALANYGNISNGRSATAANHYNTYDKFGDVTLKNNSSFGVTSTSAFLSIGKLTVSGESGVYSTAGNGKINLSSIILANANQDRLTWHMQPGGAGPISSDGTYFGAANAYQVLTFSGTDSTGSVVSGMSKALTPFNFKGIDDTTGKTFVGDVDVKSGTSQTASTNKEFGIMIPGSVIDFKVSGDYDTNEITKLLSSGTGLISHDVTNAKTSLDSPPLDAYSTVSANKGVLEGRLVIPIKSNAIYPTLSFIPDTLSGSWLRKAQITSTKVDGSYNETIGEQSNSDTVKWTSGKSTGTDANQYSYNVDVIFSNQLELSGKNVIVKESDAKKLTTPESVEAIQSVEGRPFLSSSLTSNDIASLAAGLSKGTYSKVIPVTYKVQDNQTTPVNSKQETWNVVIVPDESVISDNLDFALYANDAEFYDYEAAALANQAALDVKTHATVIYANGESSTAASLNTSFIDAIKSSTAPSTVPITYTASSGTQTLSKTVNINILQSLSKVTVQFEDELGNALAGYTIELGGETQTPIHVGDTINLLTVENNVVQTQINNLIKAGYEIVTRPTNETTLAITSTTQIVTYTVKGLLFLQSAPSAVDFGSLTYNAKIQRVDNPTTNGKLVITDTRATKTNGWTLYAAITTEMKNTSTGSIMSDALRYVTTAGNEVTLSASNQAVYNNTAGGTTDITSGWGTTSNTAGLKLVADPTKTTVSSVGTYSGVITWTIMAGQP